MNTARHGDDRGDPIGEFCRALEGDKGLTARLRRARSPDEVLGLEVVIRLADRLQEKKRRRPDVLRDDAVAALAILLAQTKVDRENLGNSKTSLAARLGLKSNGRRLLSESRFARLIHAQDVETRLRQLRRILPILNTAVPARVLEESWDNLNTATGRHHFARGYFTASDNSESDTNAASTTAAEMETTP